MVKERSPNIPRVIYVAGGYFRQSLDILEGFNVDEKTWTQLDRITVPRSGLGGAFLNVCRSVVNLFLLLVILEFDY